MDIENMIYERIDEQLGNVSRAGVLHTSFGSFEMPAFSASLKRRFEAEALLRNVQAGMGPQVISPNVSYRNYTIDRLSPLIGNNKLGYRRPLVLPDIESEALNFNCVARENFRILDQKILPKVRGKEEVVDILFRTGLSSSDNYVETHSAWRRAEKEFSLSPLVDWIGRHLQASMSDVMIVPTPIVRSDVKSVDHAIGVAEDMVSMAKKNTIFTLFGSHFLIHSEFFGQSSPAHLARVRFIQLARLWIHNTSMNNTFISMKIYDPSGYLSNPASGGIFRRNISEFVEEIQNTASTFGGVVVFHDTGNRFLGFIDSGSDIVTSKPYRDPGIERVIIPKGNKKRDNTPPPLTARRMMVDMEYSKIKRWYLQTGGFPVPDFMDPIDYGIFPDRNEQKVYASRARIGSFHEITEWYRNAQLDQLKTLREAMASIYLEAENKQDLADMCPSLR